MVSKWTLSSFINYYTRIYNIVKLSLRIGTSGKYFIGRGAKKISTSSIVFKWRWPTCRWEIGRRRRRWIIYKIIIFKSISKKIIWAIGRGGNKISIFKKIIWQWGNMAICCCRGNVNVGKSTCRKKQLRLNVGNSTWRKNYYP